jgi:hypothetical protein
MLHFTPHKRARIAFREAEMGGGIEDVILQRKTISKWFTATLNRSNR